MSPARLIGLRATLAALCHQLGPHYVIVSFTCDKCGHEQHQCLPATSRAECIMCVREETS